MFVPPESTLSSKNVHSKKSYFIISQICEFFYSTFEFSIISLGEVKGGVLIFSAVQVKYKFSTSRLHVDTSPFFLKSNQADKSVGHGFSSEA